MTYDPLEKNILSVLSCNNKVPFLVETLVSVYFAVAIPGCVEPASTAS